MSVTNWLVVAVTTLLMLLARPASEALAIILQAAP